MQASYDNKKIPVRDFELNVSYHLFDQQATTIVFLHDSLGCVSLWRGFPEGLANAIGANIMLYDRRGYGLSAPFSGAQRSTDYMETEADILIELLEQCDIRNPILFGHSDGGTIALLAAAQYPEKIKAIITEGAHVFVEEITLDGIERAKEQYLHNGLKERLEKYHGDKTQSLFEAWADTWLSEAYRSWNIERFLPRITCPTLVIQGAEDEYGSVAQMQAIAHQTSGPSDLCIVVNAGHSPHKQSEHWIIDCCYAFLDKQGLLG